MYMSEVPQPKNPGEQTGAEAELARRRSAYWNRHLDDLKAKLRDMNFGSGEDEESVGKQIGLLEEAKKLNWNAGAAREALRSADENNEEILGDVFVFLSGGDFKNRPLEAGQPIETAEAAGAPPVARHEAISPDATIEPAEAVLPTEPEAIHEAGADAVLGEGVGEPHVEAEVGTISPERWTEISGKWRIIQDQLRKNGDERTRGEITSEEFQARYQTLHAEQGVFLTGLEKKEFEGLTRDILGRSFAITAMLRRQAGKISKNEDMRLYDTSHAIGFEKQDIVPYWSERYPDNPDKGEFPYDAIARQAAEITMRREDEGAFDAHPEDAEGTGFEKVKTEWKKHWEQNNKIEEAWAAADEPSPDRLEELRGQKDQWYDHDRELFNNLSPAAVRKLAKERYKAARLAQEEAERKLRGRDKLQVLAYDASAQYDHIAHELQLRGSFQNPDEVEEYFKALEIEAVEELDAETPKGRHTIREHLAKGGRALEGLWRKAKEAVRGIPPEKQQKIGEGLDAIDASAREDTASFWTRTMASFSEKFPADSAIRRFLSATKESFGQDLSKAKQDLDFVKRGKVMSGLSLGGKILKWTRVATDFTGFSPFSYLRGAMLGAMLVQRGGEITKEARMKSDESRDARWIKDYDAAYEEAWGIYNQAKQESGGDNASKEDLEKVYRRKIPKELIERFNKEPEPGMVSGFMQRIAHNSAERLLKKIDSKIDAINTSGLSDEEKKVKIDGVLYEWRAHLHDLDRVVHQSGVVDATAMNAKTVEKWAERVKYALIIESAGELVYKGIDAIVNDKLPNIFASAGRAWERIGNMLGGDTDMSGAHEIGAAPVVVPGSEAIPGDTGSSTLSIAEWKTQLRATLELNTGRNLSDEEFNAIAQGQMAGRVDRQQMAEIMQRMKGGALSKGEIEGIINPAMPPAAEQPAGGQPAESGGTPRPGEGKIELPERDAAAQPSSAEISGGATPTPGEAMRGDAVPSGRAQDLTAERTIPSGLVQEPPGEGEVPSGLVQEPPGAEGIAVNPLETGRKGYYVWNMIEHQLAERYPEFSQLSESEKLIVIDAFKDQVVENPSILGIQDANKIREGQSIDFSKLFRNPDDVEKIFSNVRPFREAIGQSLNSHSESILNWFGGHPGEELTPERVEEIFGPQDYQPAEASPEVQGGTGIDQPLAENATISEISADAPDNIYARMLDFKRDEYETIKNITLKQLFDAIPEGEDPWTVRSELFQGIRQGTRLPSFDGRFSSDEYTKQIKLAEFLRDFRPNERLQKLSVGSIMDTIFRSSREIHDIDI